MSLTIAEASAINTLIHHLTGQDPHRGPELATPGREDAIGALVLLADSAHHRLSAGFNAKNARAVLEAHWLPTDPADQPIGHIPTKAGLDYLALRRQQHPRQATHDV